MSKKIYLTILKIGIYLSFLSVFLVSDKLLFPYITTKQIYFNILIEILAVFWVVFLIKYPEHRPKKSWISIGLVGYFVAILISSIFSVDFNLSFWGDIERMLGFFHIFHFLIFYFIIITVFHEWKDWKILFIVSIICATIVSFYGLANTPYSTLGNTAYVSGYLIFNIYFVLLLFFREENKILRWIYIAVIPIMLIAFYQAYTSGAIVGLAAGFFVFLFLLAVFSKNKKLRIYSLSAVVIFVSLVFIIYANKDISFVKNNSFLSRLTSNVSSQKVTFQTRLISWKAAMRDFSNHPIFGAGYGNFAISFDKYFDPVFYNYTRSETYFDRAHNNIIDIASTTGIVGLLTYLSIFLAAGYYLIKGFRKDKINLIEFSLVSSLIIAYFVQNLAVFDSLVTYMGLMIILGYLYWLNQDEGFMESAIDSLKEKFFKNNLNNKEIFSFLIVGILIFTIFYQYNFKPLKMLKGTIDGQIVFAQGNFSGGVEEYKKTLNYNTVLDRDSRDSLIRLVVNSRTILEIDKEKAGGILDFVIGESEKNLEYNPKDSLTLLVHSQLLNVAATVFKDDPEKFNYYSNLAEEAINKSIESAPGRIPHYFQKTQIYVTRGDYEKAFETLKFAESLNEDYYESTCKLAKLQIILEKEEGYDNMDKCLDKGGAGELSPASFVGQLINYYHEKKDNVKVLKLYERLSQLDSNNPKVFVNLATLYAQAGEKEKAIKAAQKVIELDPTLKGEADAFINSLGR